MKICSELMESIRATLVEVPCGPSQGHLSFVANAILANEINTNETGRELLRGTWLASATQVVKELIGENCSGFVRSYTLWCSLCI